MSGVKLLKRTGGKNNIIAGYDTEAHKRSEDSEAHIYLIFAQKVPDVNFVWVWRN